MIEKEFIQKLKSGDRSAYKNLFSQYYSWLCNYVYKLTNDNSIAEDLVQEVFINLWEKREQINISSSLKNYLFRACHNQFLQHLRKEKIRIKFLNSIQYEVLFDNYDSESKKIHEDKLEKLNSLISQLPPKCKDIFTKSKLQKMKYKDIAIELNISIKTVENQMSKALKFLKSNSIFLFI
jgi:RNA polymerase sigma-70 factor (family 1)